jgi:TolB protein
VTTSGNVTHIFGWSHDGSQLLLGIGERPVLAETDMPGGTDLWVLDIKDGRTIQLTRGLGVQNAAWSPTNNEIAYTMLNDGLYLVKSDGARLRKVADKALYDLAWSPQGAKIAFILPPSTWTGGLLREYDIAVLNVDDKSITQLTSNAWTNYHPVWSSDGQKILFESDREHSPNTGLWYIMNADGSSLRHLGKPALLSSMNVTKSPIANQVAFEVSNEIWVMDFDGSVLRVTEGSEPYWSPDGNRLAYVGKDNGMWVINVDGTNAQSLFNSGRQLHWSK